MIHSVLLILLLGLGTPNQQPTLKEKSIKLAPGVTIEMIYVAPGTFTMGNTGEEDQWTVDAAAHKVTLTKGFWMAKYEITQEVYQKVMGTNPSRRKGDSLPVEQVSWHNAMAFVEKARKYTPTLHLPTEAQWEYACKAGTDKAYSRDRDLMTWHKGNSGVQTHEVGTKLPNLWGFYDLHGNVGEWVRDWKEPFGSTAVTDPLGPEKGDMKLIKGGQHTGRPRHTYSYDRQRATPDRKLFYVGFRVVMEEE